MKLAATIVVAVVAVSSFARSAAAAEKPCAVERAVGLGDAEIAAVEDVVCGWARDEGPRGATHRIRVSAVGGRYVLTLRQEHDGIAAEKQVIVGGIEEVAVAAPRLLEALAEEKRLEETQTTSNLVETETRKPKRKPGEMHASMGVIGIGAFSGSAQGGAQFGVEIGSPSLSFVGDLRVGGDVAGDLTKGFTLGIVELYEERSLGYASLASGARHHFSDGDTSPFVGVGLALDAISATNGTSSEKNAGIAGVLEVGLDVLRTSTVGGAVALRVDAPAFELRGAARREDGRTVTTRSYAPIVAAAFSLRF